MRILLLFILILGWGSPGFIAQKEKIDLEGPVIYTSSGVKLLNKSYSWSKINSLVEEKHPSGKKNYWELLTAKKKPPEDLWKTYQEKQKELLTKKKGIKTAKTKLAAWCKKKKLYVQQWQLLTQVLVEDGWYRKALKPMLEVTEYRFPATIGIPPFEGRWEAFEDRTKHHQHKCWAHWAIDFVKVDELGRDFQGTGRRVSDHYSWGEPIYSIADGKVVHAEGHFPDLPIGRIGGYDKANSVVIQHANGEYSLYGHLKQGTVTVKTGELVKQGQVIGKVGNSGRSGMPHLHFALCIVIVDSVKGKAQYLGVPYVFKDFVAYKRKDKKKKKIHMKLARPQEGWILECPKPTMAPLTSENESIK